MTFAKEAKTGFDNTGDYNSGDKNTGCMNSGDWNTGDWNLGMKNTGCRNEGNWNTGDFNKGSFCSGDWNLADNSGGVFCCEMEYIRIFDMPTRMTLEDWRQSPACKILRGIRTSQWSHSEGSLKEIPIWEGCGRLWKGLREEERRAVMAIPNFNPEKFKQITGIDVKLWRPI